MSSDKLQSLLETLPGMGGLKVSRSGLCHSYIWTIDWLQVGGDRPALIVNDTGVKVSSEKCAINEYTTCRNPY